MIALRIKAQSMLYTVADPDFKLRRGPSFNLLAQPAFLPSVISSFFYPK